MFCSGCMPGRAAGRLVPTRVTEFPMSLRPILFALPLVLSACSGDRERPRASSPALEPGGAALASSHATHAHEPAGPPPPSSVSVPLDAAALAPLPRSPV